MNLVITGIGSTPYRKVRSAIRYSFKHGKPFLPELTAKGETMANDYIKFPGAMLCLYEFVSEIKKQGCKTVKLQTPGVVLLMQNGYSADNAVTAVNNHVSVLLHPFRELGLNQIDLFIDEPGVGTYPNYDALPDLWSPVINNPDVKELGVKLGLHTCGNMEWDRLYGIGIKTISFDASLYDIMLSSKYNEFRESGGRVGWGVDFGKGKRFRTVADIIEHLKKHAKDGDYLTLACGASHFRYTPAKANAKLRMLQSIERSLYS
ncbi:MAG: hypothetical protein V1836_03930 [Candidatus Aenigmatarchaeota archaeon]